MGVTDQCEPPNLEAPEVIVDNLPLVAPLRIRSRVTPVKVRTAGRGVPCARSCPSALAFDWLPGQCIVLE